MSKKVNDKTLIRAIKANENNETSILIVFVAKSANESRESCAYSCLIKGYSCWAKKITRDAINVAITLLVIGPLQKFFILFIVLCIIFLCKDT